MDPQSAANALNLPWWAKNPLAEGIGSNVQSFVNALSGGNQILPEGFASRLSGAGMTSPNIEYAGSNLMHGPRQDHLFKPTPDQKTATSAFFARGDELYPNSNLARDAGYADIVNPDPNPVGEEITALFRGGTAPPEMQPTLPDLPMEAPAERVPMPRPRPKKK